MLFAQLWGAGGVHILTFTVIPTPFMRTSRRVGAGLGAHCRKSLSGLRDITPVRVELEGIRNALEAFKGEVAPPAISTAG